MKIFAIACLLLLSFSTRAANWYISATGNNTSGNSPANAWTSIAKLNASWASINPGDFILFNRGETFYGQINIGKSGTAGNPITIDAYGTGALPVITGLTTLSTWVNDGGGVQHCNVVLRNALNLVTINGIPQEVGRFPNAGTANAGYAVVSASTGNTAITSATLAGTNWTGAEVLTRKRAYVVERNKVSSQSGATLNYSPSIATINPRNSSTAPAADYPAAPVGFGAFVQRDIRTLDKFGEWFYDSINHVVSMFFGAASPASYTIAGSSLDTLINIGTRTYITVTNLNLTGANLAAVFFYNSGNITVKNCTISNSGAKAVFGWYTPNTLIDGNTITWALCSAIDVRSPANNVTATNNLVSNIAMYQGMASFYDPADAVAIYVGVGATALVRKNKVDTCGFNGIRVEGSSLTVDTNLVRKFGYWRSDGGGIYTWSELKQFVQRVIRKNIIVEGMDASAGTTEDAQMNGIYSDDGERDIVISDNAIGNLAKGFGLFFNSPKDILARRNIVYNADGWYANRLWSDSLYNFRLSQNILYNKLTTQFGGYYTNSQVNNSIRTATSGIQNAIQLLGAVDTNYYNLVSATPFKWYYKLTNADNWIFPPGVSYSTWLTYSLLDSHSSATAYTSESFQYNWSPVATTYDFNGLSKKIQDPATGIYTVYNNSAPMPAFFAGVFVDNGTAPTTGGTSNLKTHKRFINAY